MTLELKQYNSEVFNNRPYLLGGVKEITEKTEYGVGRFAMDFSIFGSRVYTTDCYEYVKDAESGKYYVKNGKWVKD